MPDDQRGVLHRHEDGREHRHFSAGFTIGGQVIEDADGTEDHQHSVLGVQPGDVQNNSGPVVWTERDEPHSIDSLDVEFWEGAPTPQEARARLGKPEPEDNS